MDQKQQKLVDVMNKIEQENKKQITSKVQFLEQNDIKMQKELSEVYDLLREVRTRVGVVAGDIEARIAKFDQLYKEKISQIQKQIDGEIAELKAGIDKFMKELFPKIQQFEGMEERLNRLLEISTSFDKRIQQNQNDL